MGRDFEHLKKLKDRKPSVIITVKSRRSCGTERAKTPTFSSLKNSKNTGVMGPPEAK